MAILQHTKKRIGAEKVSLIMPYIPNARQDRVKSKSDVFTLKYFADFINNLHFDRVIVLDPHGKDCNAVIGISGGIDSSTVAALCVEALGKDRVFGVLMPNGVQKDIDFAVKLVEHLGIKHTEVNIYEAYTGIIDNIVDYFEPTVDGYYPINITEQTKINLPARLRMATLYAVSQSMNGRVMNTCNLSEDYIGYSTRYGDAAGDFSPLAMLTKTEVIAIAEACGLPVELSHKTPTDGLCGKTDEDNFGFTYAMLDKYIRTGVCDDENVKKKIDVMHNKNLFKLQLMPCYEYFSKN